jgi:hypothetical protein
MLSIKLEHLDDIKDTSDTDRSASYLDLHLEIDSEGRLRTQHYDKRDDFNILTNPVTSHHREKTGKYLRQVEHIRGLL